jgi:hypothetical protein
MPLSGSFMAMNVVSQTERSSHQWERVVAIRRRSAEQQGGDQQDPHEPEECSTDPSDHPTADGWGGLDVPGCDYESSQHQQADEPVQNSHHDHHVSPVNESVRL